jgi:WD40 repeat protein
MADPIYSVAWSPDGTELALGSADNTASVLDARTGARRLHLEGLHSDDISSVAWSPDGTELALGSMDNTASVLDARTGARRLHMEGLHSAPILGMPAVLCRTSARKARSR